MTRCCHDTSCLREGEVPHAYNCRDTNATHDEEDLQTDVYNTCNKQVLRVVIQDDLIWTPRRAFVLEVELKQPLVCLSSLMTTELFSLFSTLLMLVLCETFKVW